MGPSPVAIQNLTKKRLKALLRGVLEPEAAAVAATLAAKLHAEPDGAEQVLLLPCSALLHTLFARLEFTQWEPKQELNLFTRCSKKHVQIGICSYQVSSDLNDAR